jgi:hypothetical protein
MSSNLKLLYWKVRAVYFVRKHPIKAAGYGTLLAIISVVLVIFRRKSLLALKVFWHASVLVWLKVIAYGLIPIGLAIFGAHYAAEAVQGKSAKRMVRFLFIVSGIVCVLMISYIETKGENEHAVEVGGLTSIMATVQTQNNQILQHFVAAAPDQQTREVTRRDDILTLLRHEWILSHKNISSGLLTGAEQPPADWINQRLSQLGEKWSVQEKPNSRAPAFPTQVYNSPDPLIGQSNSDVALWAQQEADKLQALGTQCATDEISAYQRKNQGLPITIEHLGIEGVQARFWQDFTKFHRDAITKLHDSLVYRLGPVVTAPHEAEYKQFLEAIESASRAPMQQSWVLCMNAEYSYPDVLRDMAMRLLARPQVPPVAR